MALQDLQNRIRRAISTIQNDLPRQIAISGEALSMYIAKRAQSEQKGFSGVPFPVYSKQWYAVRQKKGYHNIHMSFEFTREMWLGFGVKQAGRDFVTLGGTTGDSQQKIDENSKRVGYSIIKPSEKELEKERLRLIKWMNDTINSQ
jgi:hypothetical protein